ncbi:MAG: cell division protein FtsH [Rhodopirellula sp.]|nr:cell division protein FtsH [Rhodopirellula sp.]
MTKPVKKILNDRAGCDGDKAVTAAGSNAFATAYHEAGHAVMAVSFGCLIKKVTIVPGRSGLGQYRLGVCELQKGRSANAKNLLDDEIVILFAGMVAEAHFTGRYCEAGAAEDLRTIRRLLCRRVGSDKQHERLRRRLLARTEHLLDDEATALAVEMVATELVQKQTISGRAVRHFYQQAMRKSS